jgi:hypothetical protein
MNFTLKKLDFFHSLNRPMYCIAQNREFLTTVRLFYTENYSQNFEIKYAETHSIFW